VTWGIPHGKTEVTAVNPTVIGTTIAVLPW